MRSAAELTSAVAGERRMRIIEGLFPGGDVEVGGDRLCEMCAAITGMSGAGIMLMSDDVPQSSAGASNDLSARIDELQYTMGEGPCVEAVGRDGPVLEPDLANPVTPRWFGFTGPALEAGVRAVFGFPLQVGAVRFGALNLYRDRPGPLGDDQHADALVVADVAAEALLLMQAQAPLGALAEELATKANTRSVVHQASGMISAQLDVSVAQALIRLRAYAFSHDRRLLEVADDVVARRVRFTDDEDRNDLSR